MLIFSKSRKNKIVPTYNSYSAEQRKQLLKELQMELANERRKGVALITLTVVTAIVMLYALINYLF